MDVADMKAFQAAMESEGAAEAVAYDGVLPETLVDPRRGIARRVGSACLCQRKKGQDT